MKTMAEYFFLRPGFERFQLEPEINQRIVIGDRDRKYRDDLLNSIEDGAAALDGYTAVIYGDYGRGKTHEAQNIKAEVKVRGLPVKLVYVKCHEFKAKEPFSTLFSQLLLNLGTEEVRNVANEYQLLEQAGKVVPLKDILQSDELVRGFGALAVANLDRVRDALRWLGGEKGIDTELFASSGMSPQLTVSRDFALVMKGMAHMFASVRKQVLVYLIDEAEQFKQVKNPETYASWVGCIRALTESLTVGYVFYVGANSPDDLPDLFLWDEVRTRIGNQNYRDLLNPSVDELKQWIRELFKTLVRKGPVPPPHVPAMTQQALDPTVPPELQALVASSPEALEAYPFTPEALEIFADQCMSDEFSNRPREVLKRIQAAAKRAMRKGLPIIDVDLLNELRNDVV